MRRLGVLLTAMTVLAACSDDPSSGPAATGAAPVGTESAGGLRADLFDVRGVDVDGNTVDLAGYAGRDVVVWFWAPW